MASEVIDVLFRARDADKVAKASRLVGTSLEDLGRQGAKGAAGLDKVEQEAKQADRALDELEKRKGGKLGKPSGKPVATPGSLTSFLGGPGKAAGETKKLQDNLDKMGTSAKKASGQVGGLGNSLGGAVGGKNLASIGKMALGFGALAIGVAGAAAAFQKILGAITGTIGAASRQEDANLALAVSMQTVGQYSVAASKDIQEYASAIQQTTAFGDEAVVKTAALIQQLGGLSGQALKDTTTAALDMAVAMERNVDQVAILLGKAAAGETGSLSEYGIIIDQSLPRSEKFAAALDAINKAFGGSAAARVKSYSGATAQLGNAMGDLSEAIGEAVLPALTKFANLATPIISKLVAGIRSLRGETEASAVEMVSVMETQTAAMRGLGAEQAAIVGKAREQLEERAVAQLQLEVSKGNLNDVIDTIAELDKVVQESSVKGEEVFANFMRRMRTEAVRGLSLRMNIEVAKSRAAIGSAIKKLQGEADLELLLKGTPEFQEARRQLLGLKQEAKSLESVEPKIVIVNELDLLRTLDDAKKKVDAIQAELGTLFQGADRTRLELDLGPALQEIDKAQAAVDKFNRDIQQGIDAGKVTFSLQPPSRAEVAKQMIDTQQGLDRVAELSATFDVRLADAKDVATVKTLLQDYEALFLLQAKAAENNPGQRQVALALEEEVRRAQQAAKLRVEVVKPPELEGMIGLVRTLQDLGGKTTSIKVLDTEAMVRDLEGATQAMVAFRASVDTLAQSRDPGTLATSILAIEVALDGARKGTVEMSAEMQAFAEDSVVRLRALVAELEPLEKAQFLRAEAEILVNTNQLKEALVLLLQMKQLAQDFPSVEIQAQITGLEASIAKAKDTGTDGGNEIRDAMASSFEKIGFTAVEDAFRRNLLSMEDDARSTTDVIRNLMTSMIDAIISKLAALAASTLFNFVVGKIAEGAGKIKDKIDGGTDRLPGQDPDRIPPQPNQKGSGPGSGPQQPTPTGAGSAKPGTNAGGPPSQVAETLRLIQAQQAPASRLMTAQLRALATPQATAPLADVGRAAMLARGPQGFSQINHIQALDSSDFERYLSPGQPGGRAIANLQESGQGGF